MRPSRILIALLLLASACGAGAKNSQPQNDDAGAVIQGAGLDDASGGFTGDAQDSQVPDPDEGPSMPAKATDSITLRGNLDQTAPILQWDGTSPVITSNFRTSLNIYDSAGKAIQVAIYFVRDDAAKVPGDSGAWSYYLMTDRENLIPAHPETPVQIGAGSLRFDTAGRLVSNVPTMRDFNPRDAVCPQVLDFNFGTGTEAGGGGLDGITQFPAPFAITFLSQSGG